MKKVKVIQLISSMNIGGAETMVKDYALLIDKEKIDCIIISMDKCYHSANEQVLQTNGIRIIYLSEMIYKADKKLNILQRIKRNLSRYYFFRQIILKERPDVLHVHLFIGHYLDILPLKKLNLKLFYTVHNIPERFFDDQKSGGEKYKMFRTVNRLVHHNDMTLIALHDTMNKQLKDLFHTDNVVTINNGIDLSRFQREKYDRLAKRKQLGLAEDEYVIGNIGRFHEQKNHQFMIEIFRRLLQIQNKARLILIGEGDLKKPITNQLKAWNIYDKVIFLENRKDIPELLCAMDVFLFPSRFEGFGNVLLEAQSIGVPCVISDKVPCDVRVTDNITILSLQDTIDKWVDCVLNPKRNVEKIGELEDYNMATSVKKLQTLYFKE